MWAKGDAFRIQIIALPCLGVYQRSVYVYRALGQYLTSHNRTGLAAKSVQNCQMKKNTKYILFVYMRKSYKAKDITLGPRHKNKTFYDLLWSPIIYSHMMWSLWWDWGETFAAFERQREGLSCQTNDVLVTIEQNNFDNVSRTQNFLCSAIIWGKIFQLLW